MHRDLKLENLLLATPNDIHKVKIADFGLAKKAAESAMATICGTPQYVAPEVIQVSHLFMFMWAAQSGNRVPQSSMLMHSILLYRVLNLACTRHLVMWGSHTCSMMSLHATLH